MMSVSAVYEEQSSLFMSTMILFGIFCGLKAVCGIFSGFLFQLLSGFTQGQSLKTIFPWLLKKKLPHHFKMFKICYLPGSGLTRPRRRHFIGQGFNNLWKILKSKQTQSDFDLYVAKQINSHCYTKQIVACHFGSMAYFLLDLFHNKHHLLTNLSFKTYDSTEFDFSLQEGTFALP